MGDTKRRMQINGKAELDRMPDELEGDPEGILGCRVVGTFEAIVTGRATTEEGPETRRGVGETTTTVLDKLTIKRVDPPPEPDPELPGISEQPEDPNQGRADLR